MSKTISFKVSKKTHERLLVLKKRHATWKQYFILCAIRNEKKVMELSPAREGTCERNIKQMQRELCS